MDRASVIQGARTFLFVPANRPELFVKALGSGADVVVLDLEDAVPAVERSQARENVLAVVSSGLAGCDGDTGQSTVMVRISEPGTADGETDLTSLAGAAVPVMVAKSTAASVASAAAALGEEALILPLVESAQGILDLRKIVSVPGVVRLALGHLDLAAELGVAPTAGEVLAGPRSAMLLASIAAGLPAPVDGVSVEVRDVDAVGRDTVAARERGWTGRLCIHPEQVRVIHELLAPTADELAEAHLIMAAAGSGAIAEVDGRMVDRPVILRARAVLARHGSGNPSST